MERLVVAKLKDVDFFHRPGNHGGHPALESPGTARARSHLRQISVSLNLLLLNQPEVMIANPSARFAADGNLTDENTKAHLRNLLHALTDWTRRLSGLAKE